MAKRSWPQGFDVKASAPETFRQLQQELRKRGRISVSDKGCENNIYGSHAVNHCARAWHDWVHLECSLGFEPSGELAAFQYQTRQVAKLLDVSTASEINLLLEAEIVGQSLYFQRHRKYVKNQRVFVARYLVDKNAALATAV